MRDENSILAAEERAVRALQLTIRGELGRRKTPLKAVAFDAEVSYPTVVSWFPEGDREPSVLSVAGLRRLIGVIPPDLLSLLLPEGWQIVRVPEAINHDEIAEAMMAFLAEKERAHHPESPAGREIAPCEDNVLRGKFATVAGKAA